MRITQGVHIARRIHHQYPHLSSWVILEDIAAWHRVTIDRHPFDDSVAGVMLHLGGRPVVALNSRNTDERQLFTLAHELGHFLLGHSAGLLTEGPMVDDPADEREANAFAAEFLMPAARIAKWAAAGADVSDLCRNTGVSREAMVRRLKELGLGRVVGGQQDSGTHRKDTSGNRQLARMRRSGSSRATGHTDR